MLFYITKRLLQSFIVIFFVTLLAFSMFHYIGDPINQIVGIETSREDQEILREQLGLNDPALVQFGRYLFNAAQGEFGFSYQHKRPVATLLAERFPATFELALVAGLFSLVVGIPMGIYTGLNRTGWLSRFFMAFSLVGISLPTFLIGILFIFIFSVNLQWLPSYGRGEVIDIFGWDTGLLTLSGLRSLIMPSITLGMFQLTLVMRLVRSEMLEVLLTDFIKFARARGLSYRAIYFGHALKNTLVPVITIIGLQMGSLLAFAIITETVFQWPGMGLLFLQAIQNVDIPIMAAYLMMVAVFFVVINLIVDILYYVIDPRLRMDSVKEAAHG